MEKHRPRPDRAHAAPLWRKTAFEERTDMGGKAGRSGRKPLFGKAMTAAERMRRRYDRVVAPRREALREMWAPFWEALSQDNSRKKQDRPRSQQAGKPHFS